MDIDGENENNNNNNGNSELYPIAVLIDELKSDDEAARLRSVQALVRIGNALGPVPLEYHFHYLDLSFW